MKIEGPVVGQFEHLFIQTWHAQNGDGIDNPPPTPATLHGDMSVQAHDGNPDRGRYTIYRTLVVAIALAHQSVHLTTAYFVPPPDLIRELKAAAARGVEVTLVLPSESDSDLSLRAGHAFYEDLIESGVHIYERQGVILHAKTAVVDGAWSMVGPPAISTAAASSSTMNATRLSSVPSSVGRWRRCSRTISPNRATSRGRIGGNVRSSNLSTNGKHASSKICFKKRSWP